jgi:NitT/TauT family transport system substrate-binding protein
MPGRRARAALAAAVVAMAPLATGCADHGAARPDPLEKRDLTVAVVPAVDFAGFFVALEQGLFAAQGLHVRYVPAISSETVIGAQEAGTYDITAGNYVSYLQAEAGGSAAGLQIIAEGSTLEPGVQCVYVSPGSAVRTVPELKGLRVAINAPDNINYLLVVSVLADYQIPAADVHFVPVPFQAMAQALTTGEVAAAAIPEPFGTEFAQSIGATTLFDTDQGPTQDLPIGGYVATRAWARENPGTLAAFTRALEQGQEIADTNRTVVQAAMQRYVGLSDSTTAVMALDFYPIGISRIQLQRVADLAHEYGLLQRPLNINSLLG